MTGPLVFQAISLLGNEEQAQLNGTEIVVRDMPSRDQIQDELDPRQIVFAEGIDSERGSFRKLWVFVRNLARSGVMPDAVTHDLAEMILLEICPKPTDTV